MDVACVPHERQGWTEDPSVLVDFGDAAEKAYRLDFDKTVGGKQEYHDRLLSFIDSLPRALSRSIVEALQTHSASAASPTKVAAPEAHDVSVFTYKTIWQTDKVDEDLDDTKVWKEMNQGDGRKLEFLDDTKAAEWIKANFKGTVVDEMWQFMHRGVLRADLLRYLLLLVHGGVYTDVDTRPIRPIEQWGKTDPEYLDISHTDGPSWRNTIARNPEIILALESDVHAMRDWQNCWPRPVGICQWTMASAPNHPIFLDAVRRVCEATKAVQVWEEDRHKAIAKIEAEKQEGWEDQVSMLRAEKREKARTVMEWTGPGVFTDAVMSYLLARYAVSWHRLRGLKRPLRIGEVLILPLAGFFPGAHPDNRGEGVDSPQANVIHHFRGSWRSEGN